MPRFFLAFALVFSLAACDAGDTTSSLNESAPVELASHKGGEAEPYFITEDTAVRASGETVLLRIQGETFEMTAGQAYLIGEALTRTGFDTLDGGLQEVLAEGPGGRRCEEPFPGVAVTAIEGRLFKRCPPPPPPPFLNIEVLDILLDGAADVTEAPEGIEWWAIPGGFVAEY